MRGRIPHPEERALGIEMGERLGMIVYEECKSVPQFARQCNVTIPTIRSIIDCGSLPNLSTLIRIAKKYNLSLDWLVFGDTEWWDKAYRENGGGK